MSKVLLFGAGAVGAVYAYVFTKAGATVTAVCRSNYAAAKANGFTIRSSLFGDVHISPSIVRSVSDAEGPFDYIVLCSKASPGSSPTTAEIIKPAVGPRTAIALLQNGIGIEEEYRDAFPNNPILSCVVYCPATEIESGIIRHGEIEKLEVGTYPHDATAEHKKAAEGFVELLTKAGATAHLYDDVQQPRWSKLLVNASWNPICALSRSTDVKFMNASEANVSWVRSVMLEIMAVAQAFGYSSINEEMVDWQLSRAKARMNTEGVEPSMLTDVKKGRRLEIEAIVGNTIRMAEAKSVSVPLLRSLYALAKALDESIARESIKA
ncbi:MAG: hypothetical protein M1821_002394 [Bathelium mastoideum]|nr:MAG: hypothetical protein M1821_002394 [Bathelium mastoideum]KAI9686396.1 MAG: hypothetical protein M1822_003741 [Bathelium mastoideum]